MGYTCDQCGACCRHLIIEIGYIDYLREPSLRQVTRPFKIPAGCHLEDDDGNPIQNPDPYIAGGMLACGSKMPCPMLGQDNRCTIYPTRPGDCVGMPAGGRQCQEARAMAKLPPLAPDPEP